MSKSMSDVNEKYKAASEKFNANLEKNLGLTSRPSTVSIGMSEQNKMAAQAEEQSKRQAGEVSRGASRTAGGEAVAGAKTAGLSSAQAALVGEKAATDATKNTYQNAYSNAYSTNLNSQQQQAAKVQEQQQNEQQALLEQQRLQQEEGQKEYERGWGNLGGWGSFTTGILTSDERLKNFRDISSKIDTNKYDMLKVTYKKENK